MTDTTLTPTTAPLFSEQDLSDQITDLAKFAFLGDWWCLHPQDSLALIGLCPPDHSTDMEVWQHHPLPGEVRGKLREFSKVFDLLYDLMREPDHFDEVWFQSELEGLEGLTPLDYILVHGRYGIHKVYSWLSMQATRQFLDRFAGLEVA